MYLGLFDLVGPVMHGPSSNHTGGANRIGYMAHCIFGGVPSEIRYGFSPFFYRFYTGHRTHVALTAGCLGMREYDDASTKALELAAEQGIRLSYYAIEREQVDRNVMRVTGRLGSRVWEINGISPGGGSIVIDRINGMPVQLGGSCYLYYFAAERFAAQAADFEKLLKGFAIPAVHVYHGSWGELTQLAFEVFDPLSEEALAALRAALAPEGELCERVAEPLHPFVQRSEGEPLIDSFAGLEKLAKDSSLIDLVYAYESAHSGRSREEILQEGLRIVRIERAAIERGLQGSNPLVGGFTSGSDGKALKALGADGRSLAGRVANAAMANAVALAERNASAGLIVAAPTAGAAGTLPGTLFAVAEHYGSDDKALAEAFLVSALLGILVGKDGSYAGSVAGCQVEIGVGAAMAAGAAVWLAGGTTAQVIDATSIALANTFGLTCDQPVSPVEIPCIKRNAMGASVALMGAELALAGIRSALPADDVVKGFLDVQRRMPEGTKGGCCGGLAVGESAGRMRELWQKKLKAESGS